jgi:hypothetical protein
MIGRGGSYDEMGYEEKNQLRVVSVAILTEDGLIHSLPAPNRHFNVMHLLADRYKDIGFDAQGFLLSNGKFCRRKPAKRIAEKAGQLIARASNLSELYSEDVW